MMRVKELEQRLMVLEAQGPVVDVPVVTELVEDQALIEKQMKELRDRQTKIEMQYRALNARTSKQTGCR